MLKLVDDRNLIENAQKKFEKRLIDSADIKEIECKVGHLGDSWDTKVFWSSKLGLWMIFDKTKNRFWNAFGTAKPKTGSLLNIVCEINFPFSGINRRVGGAIATDDEGKMYVIHNGRIGGGRKGIGKSLFFQNYSGGLVTISYEDQENDFALIARLDDIDLPSKVAEFVREVERIKRLVH